VTSRKNPFRDEISVGRKNGWRERKNPFRDEISVEKNNRYHATAYDNSNEYLEFNIHHHASGFHFRNLVSDLHHPVSGIKHPAFAEASAGYASIQHPASSIKYPASSI
jgi:hypothetical protein